MLPAAFAACWCTCAAHAVFGRPLFLFPCGVVGSSEPVLKRLFAVSCGCHLLLPDLLANLIAFQAAFCVQLLPVPVQAHHG